MQTCQDKKEHGPFKYVESLDNQHQLVVRFSEHAVIQCRTCGGYFKAERENHNGTIGNWNLQAKLDNYQAKQAKGIPFSQYLAEFAE